MTKRLQHLKKLLTAYPAVTAGLLLLVAALFAWRSWGQAQQAAETRSQAQAQLLRCQIVARKLQHLTPQVMAAEGPRQLLETLETTLRSAGAGDRPFGSVAVNASGALPGVNYSRSVARIELPGVSLTQAAVALDVVEGSGWPCWIESVDLTPQGRAPWHMSLEIAWLVKQEPIKR